MIHGVITVKINDGAALIGTRTRLYRATITKTPGRTKLDAIKRAISKHLTVDVADIRHLGNILESGNMRSEWYLASEVNMINVPAIEERISLGMLPN